MCCHTYQKVPREDKDTKLPAKKPSSVPEEEPDHYSESSHRTLYDKSVNKYKISPTKTKATKASADDLVYQKIQQ